jgi:uncharacterized coiled-coil protein SlyX
VGDDTTQPAAGTSAPHGALRRIGAPVLGYFDRRFSELHADLERRAADLDARLPAPDEVAELRALLTETQRELARQRDALAELADALERFGRSFAERADDVAATFAQLVERAAHVLDEAGPGERAEPDDARDPRGG